MEIILHRINKIAELKVIPKKYGTEIDLRIRNSKIILNHETDDKGDYFIDYLENYDHGTLILNIKDSGIENEVIKLVKNKNIKSFFLLDVEFPYMYYCYKKDFRNIAVRFSEFENIKNLKVFKDFNFDWIWIDTFTKLPVNLDNQEDLKLMKTCLVCPERWGRENDIKEYIKVLKKINFFPNAVMTSIKFAKLWENF